jgi:hypothetical protein
MGQNATGSVLANANIPAGTTAGTDTAPGARHDTEPAAGGAIQVRHAK